MIVKYIARKLTRSPSSDKQYWSLYKWEPATNIYHPKGKNRMTLGQLLCHIKCDDLDNWRFVQYLHSGAGSSSTLYCYPAVAPGYKDVELEVVDDLQPVEKDDKDNSEPE